MRSVSRQKHSCILALYPAPVTRSGMFCVLQSNPCESHICTFAGHYANSVTHAQVIDFYEYYEGMQEGWDGPALLVFSDGNKIGARLDRNGLRPARYWETDDGMVYVASEVGVLGDVLTNASHVVRKGRLGPGQMVCADLQDVSCASFLDQGCCLCALTPLGMYAMICHDVKTFCKAASTVAKRLRPSSAGG